MKHRCDVRTYGVYAKNRSMYDVPCPSLWVCAINRSMYDVPCPSLWGLNCANYTTNRKSYKYLFYRFCVFFSLQYNVLQ